MEYKKIIQILQENDSTILSFPDRGPWGDNQYRGNCSGYVQAFLIWKYGIKKMAELFSGSGTGYDVAKDMDIQYVGADINPTPVRPGILCVDAISDEVPESFCDADLLFMHPPYGKGIGIPYAGHMYQDPTGVLSKSNLGQMPWDIFMKTLNQVIMKYYASMTPGAYMGILMGDVRRNKVFHSMFLDIVKPGEMQQIIVKSQYNANSFRKTYARKNFVPLIHEYLMVTKKTEPYLLYFSVPKKHRLDIRDSQSATWKDVVYAVLHKLGGEASLPQIYQEVEGYAKVKKNLHWKEKVRQTLQLYESFTPTGRGVWQIQKIAA